MKCVLSDGALLQVWCSALFMEFTWRWLVLANLPLKQRCCYWWVTFSSVKGESFHAMVSDIPAIIFLIKCWVFSLDYWRSYCSLYSKIFGMHPLVARAGSTRFSLGLKSQWAEDLDEQRACSHPFLLNISAPASQLLRPFLPICHFGFVPVCSRKASSAIT